MQHQWISHHNQTKAPHLLLTFILIPWSPHGTFIAGTALVHIIHKCRAHTAAIVLPSEAGMPLVFSADPLRKQKCVGQTKRVVTLR